MFLLHFNCFNSAWLGSPPKICTSDCEPHALRFASKMGSKFVCVITSKQRLPRISSAAMPCKLNSLFSTVLNGARYHIQKQETGIFLRWDRIIYVNMTTLDWLFKFGYKVIGDEANKSCAIFSWQYFNQVSFAPRFRHNPHETWRGVSIGLPANGENKSSCCLFRFVKLGI